VILQQCPVGLRETNSSPSYRKYCKKPDFPFFDLSVFSISMCKINGENEEGIHKKENLRIGHTQV